MNLGHTDGVLLSSVITCMIYQRAEATFWFNLEQKMQDYVNTINESSGGAVFNWGFRNDYSYWREYPGATGHPVSAEVDWYGYEKCNETENLTRPAEDCMGYFKWSLSEGINGPFSFKQFTMLPVIYEGLPEKPFILQLNDLNITLEEMVWGDPPTIMNTSIFYTFCSLEPHQNSCGYEGCFGRRK
uniref:DA-P36 family member n=1 Tax=Rhipicephalus appendiculatus TaxID=34631 RepID=A0A131Z4N7_RHIAP